MIFQSNASYTPCVLNGEETHLLGNVIHQEKSLSKILFGAKIIGGGSGGTVDVLAQNSSEAVEVIQGIVNQYKTMMRRRTRIFSGSSSGLIVYSPMLIDM